MDLTLNDAQLQVLHWIADGADIKNPPLEGFKQSSVALRNRGLVELEKRRGYWHASITDAGAFYLEHGFHPRNRTSKRQPPVVPVQRKARSPESAGPKVAPPTGRSQPSPAPATMAKPRRTRNDESIPIPAQVRHPHQAVREIVDHKARLDVPAEHRGRALLILHALVQEALHRGWTVTEHPSTFSEDPWTGRRTRVSPGPDLLSIDAGDAPAKIRIHMQTKRVDHIPTEKELADAERYSWRSYPTHDYITTDLMRLEIRSGANAHLTISDTVTTRIEDKLLRAVLRIDKLSADAREAAERRRLWAIEEAERQRRAEEMRRRATRYTNWTTTLEQLRKEFVEHEQLTAAVAELRKAVADRGSEHEHAEPLGDYLAWAEQHLAESDPFRRIPLPEGERPDLSYDEWQGWKRRNTLRW